ncbi:hypothetical protein SELMODRAFT_73858 [Selaginella moellendorffii]|uniref:HMG box domain-containing protein n=1 Tax=Selaginella moellendorffii TaxID=88036 RepID=D8QQM7_SELML|nr:hypothetical protein SELMODRAFT_73858 [Selaginella moellendorffii]
MESNKENVAEGAGAPVPVSPPMRAAGKGLKSARNWEEELETMTQKLNKMRLEKEEVQKLVLEQGAKIKEQHDRIAMQSKEHEKLQEKIRKLEKVKEFQPNLVSLVCFFFFFFSSSDDSKGKKKKNDPERIKKPLSSYFLWCNDQREKVRAQNPNAGIKELSSIFGELWKSVSEEEKKPYEEIYQKNKEEYLKQLVGKEKREAEALKLLQDEKNRKLSKEILDQFMEYKKFDAQNSLLYCSFRKEKDPEKPKRPTTGYMAYSEERRPALMNENLKVPQIGKILGEEWRSMDEKARAPYEKIATDAKATYLTEMEAYNKKKAQEEVVAEQALKEKAKRDKVCGLELLKQKEKEDEAMKAEKAPRKAKAKTAEPGKPKKAATAYILFGMEYRKKLQAEMPTAKFAELTALVASKWNEMGAEEKQPYVNQAGVEKLKYQEAMEEFKRLSPDPKDGATTSTT